MIALLFYPFVGFLFLIFVFLMYVSLAAAPYRQQRYTKKYRPSVLVIVPCKGTDLTIEQNLESLKHQRYASYDIIAVVDSETDEALKFIRAARIKSMTRNKRYNRCSGKVSAIATALERFADYDVYVIADADATFPSNWLPDLIAPLSDKHVGISTTFPYFKPVGGFWSKVKMVWGFVGQSLMESHYTRFGWGGSLAFRKQLMGKRELAYFKKAISDDMAITKIAKAKALQIAYVKSAMPVINVKESWPTFIEWANRQTALFSAGSRKTAYYGIAYYSLSMLLLISAIMLTAAVSVYFIILLAPFAINIVRTYRRSTTPYAGMIVAYLAVQLLHLINLIIALNMRHITWRGRRYPVQHLAPVDLQCSKLNS